jgi:hypothetical protein
LEQSPFLGFYDWLVFVDPLQKKNFFSRKSFLKFQKVFPGKGFGRITIFDVSSYNSIKALKM